MPPCLSAPWDMGCLHYLCFTPLYILLPVQGLIFIPYTTRQSLSYTNLTSDFLNAYIKVSGWVIILN